MCDLQPSLGHVCVTCSSSKKLAEAFEKLNHDFKNISLTVKEDIKNKAIRATVSLSPKDEASLCSAEAEAGQKAEYYNCPPTYKNLKSLPYDTADVVMVIADDLKKGAYALPCYLDCCQLTVLCR